MKKILYTVVSLVLLVFLLFFPRESLASAQEGMQLWLNILLPTLLPFMILTGVLIRMLKKAGALEVHVRISSPPFLHPCYFGTDVPSNDQLIASNHSTEEIRKMIGADSLGYVDLNRLSELIDGDQGYCNACFSGNYPVDPPKEDIRGDYDK